MLTGGVAGSVFASPPTGSWDCSKTHLVNTSLVVFAGQFKDTRNCPEKAMKISHFNTNQSAPSIYIMIELCYFSLGQYER